MPARAVQPQARCGKGRRQRKSTRHPGIRRSPALGGGRNAPPRGRTVVEAVEPVHVHHRASRHRRRHCVGRRRSTATLGLIVSLSPKTKLLVSARKLPPARLTPVNPIIYDTSRYDLFSSSSTPFTISPVYGRPPFSFVYAYLDRPTPLGHSSSTPTVQYFLGFSRR